MTACANWPNCGYPYGHAGACEAPRATPTASHAGHKTDSLFWVYDAGFRWGPPDLTYPPPYASCVSKVVDMSTTFAKLSSYDKPTCEIPGCYICHPRTEQTL